MDFNNSKNREESLRLIQEIASGFKPTLETRLHSVLTPGERIVQDYVQQLSFRDGAWFRTYHNLFVPAAMVTIINNEGYNRDLIYASQIHDSGNSIMKIAKTTEGAGWEGVDKRLEHMKIGGIMIYSILGVLKSVGELEIDKERILKLKQIVETHDNPYVGKALEDPEEKAHRCADRVWVPTALSFYKDLIAYCSDEKYQKVTKKLGFNLSLKGFLLSRMAFFYEDDSQLPESWNLQTLPLLKNRVSFNEGGRVEIPYTKTGKRLVDEIFTRRASEMGPINQAYTPREFVDIFETAFKLEADYLLTQAGSK